MRKIVLPVTDFVVRRPWLSLLGLTLFVAPFLYFLATHLMNQDNSSRIWFPPQDLQYAYYDTFKEEFESDEIVTIAIEASGGVFEPVTLSLIAAIEEKFATIPNVEEVRSILSMDHVRGIKTIGGDGEAQYELKISPVVPSREEWTPEALTESRERAVHDENFIGNVISPDATFTAVFARIIATNDMKLKSQIALASKAALREIAEQFSAQGVMFSDNTNPFFDPHKEAFDKAPRKLYLAGLPVFDHEFDHMARADQSNITGLTWGGILIVLLVLFRSLLLAFLPMILMVFCVCVSWGGYLATGHTMNMMIGMSGPVLIAACVGESVHVLISYYNARQTHPRRSDAIRAAIEEVYWPCFFTAFTTAIGFGSFIWAYVPPLRFFGICTSIGALFSYIFSITLIPASIAALDEMGQWVKKNRDNPLIRFAGAPVLWMLSDPSTKTLERISHGPIARGLDHLARLAVRRRKLLFVGFNLCLVATAIGMMRVKVESNNLSFMPKSHYVRYALETVQDRLTGLSNIEVILEGPEGFATDPDVLQKVDHFMEHMKTVPNVTNVMGHTTYLKQIHKAMNGDDPAYYLIPQNHDLISQYLLLAELSGGSDLKDFFNYDYSKIRLTIRSDQTQSTRLALLRQNTRDAMKEFLPEVKQLDLEAAQKEMNTEDPREALKVLSAGAAGPTYKITGLIPLYGTLDHLFLTTLLWSFLQAFVQIYFCMAFLTRSWKMGAIAMLPNLFPIFLTGGLMGLADWRLDPATILIASVALGIAVDDTVHYVCHFPIEFARSGRNYADAIWNTHTTIGRALVSTSIILFVGFGVMIFGSFYPTRSFGGLTAMTMCFALIGDIVFLPVLYIVLKPLGAGETKASAAEKAA